MKKLLMIVLWAAFMFVFGTSVGAEEPADISSLAEDYGAIDTADSLPYDAAEFLRENNISPDDPEGITSLSPKTVIAYMTEKLKHSAAAPLRLFGTVISVVILAAAGGAAADVVQSGGSEKIYRTVAVLAAVGVTVPSLESCIDTAAQTLVQGSDFLVCYVPVFTGIAAASGNVTASAGYNLTVLLLAQAAVKIASDVLVPVISVCMAMNIIDAVNPAFSLSSITGLLKKWTSLFLGLIMTVFTGLLSIQSIVGTSADTLGVKAAKFVVSNFVPIVGSAVADAYTTMRSGLGLLRGATGAFGIIALCVTLLPPILETLCLYLAMTAGEAAAELFGANELGRFFGGAASLLAMTGAVLACFVVMFVISTVILMAAGMTAA